MDKVTQLYYNLENNIPFCFIKLNDGEISAMIDVNSILSRSDERSSLKLSEKIKECLECNRENYFIGLPCCLCYNNLYNESNKYITNKEEQNKYILNANILINTNIDTTIEIFTKTMNEKNIVIVTNANNVKNIHKLKVFNINPYKIIIVSEQFAFENDYERIKDEYKSFNDGDIILCLCGPLGRVLCYEWFKFNNSLTCLELGSLFDPLLRNRAYGYHTGIHKYCSECYPLHESNDCKLMILCDTNIYKECYYFYEEKYNFLFFDNNIKKINKNNNIRLEKEPKNNYLLKIKELVDSKINSKKNIQLKLDNGMKELELDESKPRGNNKPFYIVYHIATVSDNWKHLTQRSYNKLIESGILHDKNLKKIKISYLGDENNIQLLRDIWNDDKVDIIDFGRNVKLYEYPAINLIKTISKAEDCNILYFHCKGQLHKPDSISDWIDYLEYFNIENYKYCLDRLIDYDVVSCNYYGSDGDPCYKKNPYPIALYKKHYSGNFWWTKSSYVNKLNVLEYDINSRHNPEFWICNNEKGKFWSYYVSSINFGNNNRHKMDRNIYEGLEKLNFNFCRINDYKHLNKNELLNACEIAYGSRHLETLNYTSKLYLSFFEEFNEKETNKVRFFYGFSNYYNDRKLAKREFKKVYNSNIEDEYSFYAKCNLDTLYVKNNLSIPKIIHLIYFKGIEFEKFHYECIKSMLINMPNYKIIIYNDIEPENNKFWDDIKKNPMVSIEYISPPDHFDGFPLKFIQYKADVIRLELLYKYGGIYLDLDMLIIKNFENIINTGKDLYISEEGDKGGGLINAFLACKPNNGFVKKWLDSFKTGLRMNNWAYHIRESNKQLLEKKKHYFLKYNIEILESKHFFPFKWSEREKFLNINDNLNEDIYGIHLFETILHNDLINNPYFASNNNCITI